MYVGLGHTDYNMFVNMATVMISYSRGLTLPASIYSSSTSLIVLDLIILFDRGDII